MPTYYETIETALKQGNRLHAFLSGGGLRVVSLTDDVNVKDNGYGEHPHLDDALAYLAEDFLAGGRPYGEVYGGSKPHYLTGSSAPNTPFDAWVRAGRPFDVTWDGTDFVAVGKTYEDHEQPADLFERVGLLTPTFTWTDKRGVTFEATATKFPNGEPAVSTRWTKKPPTMTEHRVFHFWALKTGRGASVESALEAMLTAEPIEVVDEPRGG